MTKDFATEALKACHKEITGIIWSTDEDEIVEEAILVFVDTSRLKISGKDIEIKFIDKE
jgi:hypothetical protein